MDCIRRGQYKFNQEFLLTQSTFAPPQLNLEKLSPLYAAVFLLPFYTHPSTHTLGLLLIGVILAMRL